MRFSISVSPKSHSFNVFQLIFDEESKNRSLEGLRERIKDLLGKLTYGERALTMRDLWMTSHDLAF